MTQRKINKRKTAAEKQSRCHKVKHRISSVVPKVFNFSHLQPFSVNGSEDRNLGT